MSLQAVTQIWERSRAKGSALLLLLAIGDFLDKDAGGRDAWPSAQTLAGMARLSDRGVRKILHQLEADGELVVTLNVDGRAMVTPGGYRVQPKWFLEVCCISQDWPAIGDATFAPEKPEQRAGSFVDGRPRKPEKISGFTRRAGDRKPERPDRETGTPVPRNRNDQVRHIRKDPLVDPGTDPYRAGAGAPAASPPLTPDACIAVVTRVVHAVADLQTFADLADLGELVETVKSFCARPPGGGDPIPYDSDSVRKAIDAAEVQRARVGKPPIVRGSAGEAAARLRAVR